MLCGVLISVVKGVCQGRVIAGNRGENFVLINIIVDCSFEAGGGGVQRSIRAFSGNLM